MGFTKKKSVTRPVLTHKSGKIQVVFQSAIYPAPANEEGRTQKDANGQPLPPPNLAHVIDLATGEEKTLVINKVLGSELQREYPDAGYKGKAFEIEKFAAAGGKKYATYSIAEGEYTPDEKTSETVDAPAPVSAATDRVNAAPSPTSATPHKGNAKK